ncbi:MAG TPA: hypothetical protein VJW75_10210, partial [Candidatus Eisenbacteria bacterium]|nr:hypothetical protein [Candidatus Eisenbacteria bacterium]
MTNRRRAAAVLLLLPFLAVGCASGRPSSPPALGTAAGRAPGSVAAVEGTLIDMRCYSQDRAFKANDHRIGDAMIEGCAQACAKLGIPVALLTSSGDVVLLLAPSPDFADHMGREARAVGRWALHGAVRPDSA